MRPQVKRVTPRYQIGWGNTEESPAPPVLVSYLGLALWEESYRGLKHRDWVLDSGAFSAYTIGIRIDLEEYAEDCLRLMAEPWGPSEVFSLDVIGDAEASRRNTERLWNLGVPAIPCFHPEEDESFLLEMAEQYPKIALGGVAYGKGERKYKWAEQCFARVWPHRIHGFAFGSERAAMRLPWHSTDASSWQTGPAVFATWRGLASASRVQINLSVSGSGANLTGEILHHLQIEQRVRRRWRGSMRQLPPLDADQRRGVAGDRFACRLAVGVAGRAYRHWHLPTPEWKPQEPNA